MKPTPVHLEARRLAGLPCLLAWQGQAAAASRRGLVIFIHGFSASKEMHRADLKRLARAGFLALGLDAVGHGERRFSDFEARFPVGTERARRELLEVIRRTASEIPALVEALREQGWRGPLGLAGVSMGGAIAYGACLAERRLEAVAALLASPRWPGEPEDSPHRFPAAFYPRALLSICAGADETVPPEAARTFHRELEAYYARQPKRLRYVEVPDEPHIMSAKAWAVAARSAVGWFEGILLRKG